MKQQILDKINADISIDPTAEVKGDTDLLMTGLVDSLGLLNLVGWIELRLSTEIDANDIVIEHFRTVDLMVEFLEKKHELAAG